MIIKMTEEKFRELVQEAEPRVRLNVSISTRSWTYNYEYERAEEIWDQVVDLEETYSLASDEESIFIGALRDRLLKQVLKR